MTNIPQKPDIVQLDTAFTKDTKKLIRETFPKSKVNSLFNPTKKDMYDFCFNFRDSLAAFILKRLIYYRDNSPTALGFIEYPGNLHNLTDQEIGRLEQLDKDAINYIIDGFWIGVNIDHMDRTPKQQEHWDNARAIFTLKWDNLWM